MRSSCATALLWLLFIALFARGLLPNGYMPSFSSDGISIVLCTSQGAQSAVLDKNGQPLKSMHGESCPFGFALSMAAAPTASMPELPQSTVSNLASRIQAQAASATPRDAYSARGPPLLV